MELNDTWQQILPGSPSLLRWPWLSVLLLALLVALAVWWSRGDGIRRSLAVSDTARLRMLPRFRTLVRRRRGLAAAQVAGVALALLGAALLVARPASRVSSPVPPPSLDVVVCLDVSPSMLGIDAEVVDAVQEIVGSLPGDRIGLVVFDGPPVTKFPLTDDRPYVDEALTRAGVAFRTRDRSFWKATAFSLRSSQVGEGLMSCVDRFDRLEEVRGRVVLVVSDNRPFGRSVLTLEDAAARARSHDVVVHALGAPRLARLLERQEEFRAAAERTGGSLALLDDEEGVREVVSSIDSLERRRLQVPDRVVLRDRPQSGAALAGAGLAVLALVWLRRRP